MNNNEYKMMIYQKKMIKKLINFERFSSKMNKKKKKKKQSKKEKKKKKKKTKEKSHNLRAVERINSHSA